MKHGIENHFVRPDRVYATSVLTPVVGYQPVSDAYQVGARFVAGGQGLAGVFRRFGRRPRNGRAFAGGFAGPVDTIRGWLAIRFAGLRARLEALRIRAQMKQLPPGTATHVVDTSPRGQSPYPGAIPVSAGWAPRPDSPMAAAMRLKDRLFGAPTMPAQSAAAQLAPEGAQAPNAYMASVMGGLPPVVAQRGEDDLLRRWYANRLPGAGY